MGYSKVGCRMEGGKVSLGLGLESKGKKGLSSRSKEVKE